MFRRLFSALSSSSVAGGGVGVAVEVDIVQRVYLQQLYRATGREVPAVYQFEREGVKPAISNETVSSKEEGFVKGATPSVAETTLSAAETSPEVAASEMTFSSAEQIDKTLDAQISIQPTVETKPTITSDPLPLKGRRRKAASSK